MKTLSEEHKKKISQALKGKTPKNIALLIKTAKKYQKGNIAWNKGLTKEDTRVEKYASKIRKEKSSHWKGGSSTYFHSEARKLLNVKDRNKVVHHKDLNWKNNAIDNLKVMDLGEHSKLHKLGLIK